MLWPLVLGNDVEIGFAYQSFKWRNNASKNAGVTCIIVGIRPRQNRKKVLFTGEHSRVVRNIGPYLIEMDDLIVAKAQSQISALPKMEWGNKPTDGGYFILAPAERDALLTRYPEATPLIRRYYGSQEFIKGVERWCLWIEDIDLKLALSIPPVAERIEGVRATRLASPASSTVEKAKLPHRFIQIQNYGVEALIVPRLSSERRKYIPCGNLSAVNILSDQAFAIYDAPDHLISILSSRLHAIWTAAIGGRMKTDYRYSNTLVYNTFPIPVLSVDQKVILEEHAIEILSAREAHPGKTIAWLYDPDTMPSNLMKAHQCLDDALECIYIGRPFKNDTERLEHLFKLYANMIKKEQAAKATKKQTLISTGAA